MERFAINILHKRIYKICRLCGVDQPHKIPIIDGAETIIVGDEDEEASLAKKIEECVGIQVHKDDKMPQNICALCVDKINDFYEYRLMCAATNLQTRSILNLNLVEPSRKLFNFGEVAKVEDDKKEDVKKVVEVPTSSSSSIIPSPVKKGKKKRGPPSPSPSPAPTTRIKAAVDVKDEPVPVVPVKALTKKERLKQLQLQKEKEEQKKKDELKKKEEEAKKKDDGKKKKEDDKKKKEEDKKKEDEKKKKDDLKKDIKDEKLKKEKVETKPPEVNDQKHTRSKRKEPSPAKETTEKSEPTVPPPKKIKFEHPCSYCSDEFKTQGELDGHLSTKHSPLIRKFGCASCRETFDTVLESKDHNLWHQLTRTLYTCFKCKRKYDKNLALVKHMTLNACGRAARGRPPTILPDVQCRLCNKKFKTQSLYEWHGCFLKPKSNCPKCGKYFVKKQILTRHYMMFCTGTLPPPEPVIIPKAEPIDPTEKPAGTAATIAERRKRRVAFAEPELPKEEREIPFPPPLEPEASTPSPAATPTPTATPTPSGSKKKGRKDSTPTVTIKPVPPPPAATEKITSLLTSGAKLDRDSDIATINNLLSSVTEAIASISEAKAKKKKKKKDKNKDKAETEAVVLDQVPAPSSASTPARTPAPVAAPPVVEKPKPTPPEEPKKPPPAPELPAAEPKSAEELEAYALAQEVGEMTLDQQLAFCSGKLPLVVLNKTAFKQECTEIDTEPSQLQEPMEEEVGPGQVTIENGEEEDDGYEDDAANDYSGFQDDGDSSDDEPQQPESTPEEEAPETEESRQTEELQFPMPIKQEIESEEPTIAPETPEQEESETPEQEEEETRESPAKEAPQLEKETHPPMVEAPAETPKEPESLFDSRLAVNIKKEPGLEEDQQPVSKRKRAESRGSMVASPVPMSSSQKAPQESPKLILKIKKGLVEPTRSIKTIVLDDDDDDEEEQRVHESQPSKKQKLYKKPDFLAVKIKKEKVDPAYERLEPTVVNQTELPGGIRIKQERLDSEEDPHHVEEDARPTPPPLKKPRLSHKEKPVSPVIAFDGVRIKQEKPDSLKPAVEIPSPAPAEDPKPQEKKKKSKGKINPFALLRQKLAAEAAAKSAEESAAPPQAPSPLPVITNVVGNAPTPTTSSSSRTSSGTATPMAESDTENDKRVPVIARVASIAAAKVIVPEFPVAIKQEPVDEPDEEEEQNEPDASESEAKTHSRNQESNDGFPVPIKQEPIEEPPINETLSTPEEPSSPDERKEYELPRPIKEEPRESQSEDEHVANTDTSEEEPEQQQEEEKEKRIVASVTSDKEEEGNDGELDQHNETEENKDLDEEEKNTLDDVQHGTQNDEVKAPAAIEKQNDEEDEEDETSVDEKEDDGMPAAEEKKDIPAARVEHNEANDQNEEKEQVHQSTDDEQAGLSEATGKEHDRNQNAEEEDDEDGEEEEEEQEENSSLALKEKENEVHDEDEDGDEEEDEDTASLALEEKTKEACDEEDDGDEEEEHEETPLPIEEKENVAHDEEEDEDEDNEQEKTLLDPIDKKETEAHDDEEDGDEEDEKEAILSHPTEGKENEAHDDEEDGGEEEEEECSSQREDKMDPPETNEEHEDKDSEEENELEENVQAADQSIGQPCDSTRNEYENKIQDVMENQSTELGLCNQNQLKENEETENSTSPISDIPMDDYDPSSQEQDKPLETSENPSVPIRPQVSEPSRVSDGVSNERHDRTNEVQHESSSIAESSEAISLPPEPSSTSEECSDTRLESQLEELQNLLTVGLQQPLPDSSQFPQASSRATASNNDQSMVQSSSIGSSVDNNVGISGLDDDLDSLLNNKLEEMTAAQPLSAGPPQDDINLAIERELLHEMMPIRSEISAISGHEAGPAGLPEAGPGMMLDGAGNSVQQ